MIYKFEGEHPIKTALAWALKMMDLYEKRLIEKFGDPESLVHSELHTAAKYAAKTLAKGENPVTDTPNSTVGLLLGDTSQSALNDRAAYASAERAGAQAKLKVATDALKIAYNFGHKVFCLDAEGAACMCAMKTITSALIKLGVKDMDEIA